MLTGKEYKEYFDQDYFEIAGYKSNYNKNNMTRDSYLHKAIACWITQTLHLSGSESILEIGCAFGWVVEQMVKTYSLDCYGQDISQYSTDNAPSIIQDRIRECEDFEIAFDIQFDLIYSLETFEHVPEDKISTYFKNIYNALNTDGLVFCTICLGHNNDRGADIDRSHQTLQPRSWWNNKLEKAGFTIRKDLEAEAYELGLQTPEMDSGKWLPREFNWHVFVAQKSSNSSKVTHKIYDRHLIELSANQPKLLVAGSALGNFQYPNEDIGFCMNNWGNYLSYFFQCEYRTVCNDGYKEIDWAKYDLLITQLDKNTVPELLKSDWEQCTHKIGFCAGTLSMMVEDKDYRANLLELLNKFDIVLAHGTYVTNLLDTFNIDSVHCAQIFPFRYFDKLYQPQQTEEQTTILCAGRYNSHANLSSYSACLASNFADEVLMSVEPQVNLKNISIPAKPENLKLFHILPQSEFYTEILSQVDIILKMDNPAGVGRIIAEGAAGQIPVISSPDVFQVRCYPELQVPSFEAIDEIKEKIRYIQSNPEDVAQLTVLARERLKASNHQFYSTMLNLLQQLGFDVIIPEGLYW